MSRILIVLFAIIFCCNSSFPQNKSNLVQRMNEIKNQTDIYFWNQATYLHADTAKRVATERLLLSINIDRNESHQLSVEEVMPFASYINIDRGEKKQCFAYIKKTDAALIKVDNKPVTPPKPFVQDAFVQRIMKEKTFLNVHKLLRSLQAQGQILQFGKLRDVEDFSSLDLILFDMQSQEIITMLSPVTASGNRTNVVNGSEDSLENYPTTMTAVIWYIRK